MRRCRANTPSTERGPPKRKSRGNGSGSRRSPSALRYRASQQLLLTARLRSRFVARRMQRPRQKRRTKQTMLSSPNAGNPVTEHRTKMMNSSSLTKSSGAATTGEQTILVVVNCWRTSIAVFIGMTSTLQWPSHVKLSMKSNGKFPVPFPPPCSGSYP